jgi:hypothetical protein
MSTFPRRVVLTLVVIGLVVAAGAVPALATGLIEYRGRTSQDTPVRLYVITKENGRRFLRGFLMRGFDTTCEDATVERFSVTHGTRQNLRDEGTFSIDQRQSDLLSYRYEAQGTVGFKAATGTFEFLYASLTDADGSQVCTTGEMTWTADRFRRTSRLAAPARYGVAVTPVPHPG